MGSTIRRQPITRDVPKAPDYKFLNLTNFGGLNMTDNPFTAPYNTASDCKNVYVDEFNALTTRPRLEKKYDIAAKLPDGSEIVDIHNLVNGYLIHYKIEDVYYMQILPNDGELHAISGEIPTTKCVVFENGDSIYLLDGVSYKTIKDFIVSDVEGYVPTTAIGASADNPQGTPYESLNLLSDKYKKTFYWNGSTNLDFAISGNTLSVENNYLETTSVFSEDWGYRRFEPIKPLIKHPRFSKDSEIWLGDNGNVAELIKDANGFRVNKTINIFDDYGLREPTSYIKHIFDASDDGRFIVAKYYASSKSNDPDNGNGGLFLIDTKRNKGFTVFRAYSDQFLTNIDYAYDPSFKDKTLKLANDGSVIISEVSPTNSVSRAVIVYVFNEETDTYDVKSTHLFSGTIRETAMSENGSVIAILTSDGIYYTKDSKAETVVWSVLENKMFTTSVGVIGNLKLSKNGNILAFTKYNTLVFCENLENETYTEVPIKEEPNLLEFSPNNDKLFFVCNSSSDDGDDKNEVDGFVFMSDYKVVYERFKIHEEQYNRPYFTYKAKYLNVVRDDCVYATFIRASRSTPSETGSVYNYIKINKNQFLFDSSEPLLEVTYKLDKKHKEYNNWKLNADEFLASKLFTRFENNWWFAVNNKIYYTSNNDPTHVSYNNYAGLGDENSHITGFNVVQDDLLVAYKKNKLWVIKPTIINDFTTYSFLESKNTVGNTAFNASIITALTETPLQINYDGIYALNQLQNVQSSDRISVLISEAISKKWLKEPKESIDNAKTINRLYWTYIVLNDVDKTKIYLLDNRSNSWFYWELPINLLNIFVKDDITHLVDVEGNVYILTTTDVPSEFVQGKLNYYDDGHKVIDWFWNSQILSLNTINYSKRLIDTTFILTDTDAQDNYSLDYKFKAYRKLVDETDYTTLQNDIKYVQSVTKKTLIPRFKFLQIELSNDKSDDWDDYNKVRLIGLGLKYVLLEVMR